MTELALIVVLPIALVFVALAVAATSAALDARTATTLPTARASRPLPRLATPLAETARLLRQRRRTLPGADSLLWRIGGGGLPVVALMMVAVVPVGGVALVDLPVGVVWFNAMDVLLWALWWLLGWGANSGYALIGGNRFLAQALGYEVPLMFAITTPAVAAGSLRMTDVVASQDQLWFLLWMPVSAIVYLFSIAAFSSWGPFGSAAGDDVASGVLAELSGVDRLVVTAGRWMVLTAGAAFAVPMFLGGSNGPLLPAWLWILVKTVLVLAILLGVRRVLPVIRPQHLSELGWVIVLPLVLVQLLVVSVIVATGGTP